MITLLEFVCERLMGPPTRRRGNGQSSWDCPRCSHESFHTLPHRPEAFKDTVKCYRCNFRGDVFDVLWEFFPGSNFPLRKSILAEMEDSYRRCPDADADDDRCRLCGASCTDAASLISLPRTRTNEPTMQRPGNVEGAWADLTDDERAVLISALKIVRAKVPGVHMEALAVYAKEAQDWFDRDPEDIEREWLDRLREERREQAVRDAEQREQSLKLIASWAAQKKAREQAEAKKRRGPKPIRRAK